MCVCVNIWLLATIYWVYLAQWFPNSERKNNTCIMKKENEFLLVWGKKKSNNAPQYKKKSHPSYYSPIPTTQFWQLPSVYDCSSLRKMSMPLIPALRKLGKEDHPGSDPVYIVRIRPSSAEDKTLSRHTVTQNYVHMYMYVWFKRWIYFSKLRLSVFKKDLLGSGEMAQQLRILATLPED